MSSSSPLSPTFYGHIASTQDGLLLFEACLSGALNHVARRPHDRERAGLIQSGNVFIYEEHSSGIKRWTDGVPWSPSRILGNFLVYRELERPFPPGEKKRAMKRHKRSPGISKAPDPYAAVSSGYGSVSGASDFESTGSNSALRKETERSLIGSLVDSYGFKEDGLVKKTVSVTVGGVSHHLVSYYTVADVLANKFMTPTKDPRFRYITPRPELVTNQNFRTPIDEVDVVDRVDDRSVYSAFLYSGNGYEVANQNISHRPVSLPNPPVSYAHSASLYHNYGIDSNPVLFDEGFAPAGSDACYSNQFSSAPGIYSPAAVENTNVGGYRQPRYNTAMSVAPDQRPARLGSAGTNTLRRASVFDHEQGSQVDSGISPISPGSGDVKLINDTTYSSQGIFGNLRDTTNMPRSYTSQRFLPTPQTAYERAPAHPFNNMDISPKKENIWPIGNASSGHGHYTAAQQQWASTGAS